MNPVPPANHQYWLFFIFNLSICHLIKRNNQHWDIDSIEFRCECRANWWIFIWRRCSQCHVACKFPLKSFVTGFQQGRFDPWGLCPTRMLRHSPNWIEMKIVRQPNKYKGAQTDTHWHRLRRTYTVWSKNGHLICNVFHSCCTEQICVRPNVNIYGIKTNLIEMTTTTITTSYNAEQEIKGKWQEKRKKNHCKQQQQTTTATTTRRNELLSY